MKTRAILHVIMITTAALLLALPATADTYNFSTGLPDGKIATLSQPGGAFSIQTETADDFVVTQSTLIDQATFYGLIPSTLTVSAISNVQIEFYNIYPIDSALVFPAVPTRVNSPSDVSFAARDGAAGDLSFTAAVLGTFTVTNTVVNGINKSPGQFTGGEGADTGTEVLISVAFTTPILLDPGHYFFRPEAQVNGGDFLWLSAPKPIVAPGTPFTPDLQTWIRNDNLDPDWLRVGTDITHQGPFNAAFSLSGTTTPEPSGLLLLSTGLLALAGFLAKKGLA